MALLMTRSAAARWLLFLNVCYWVACGGPGHSTPLVAADPVDTRIESTDRGWRLIRGGEPYFVRGAGGDAEWPLLAQLGGNSVRTWGHDQLGEQLDHAQKLGLTVTAGIWLGQVRQGFDWSDAASLIRQRAVVREAVLRHKDHPALLMWALGNEMEDAEGKNGAVWSEINNLAAMVKSLDDRHPVMTVIAEMGGQKVRHLHELCPAIDVVGINSYAGAESVGRRYRQAGGTKPYLLTEFGPPGIWEVERNEIEAYPELTSTAKAGWYRRAYQGAVLAEPELCLGSYAFLWGQKQEVTATWFSLLLADGSRLAGVDTLSELWTGKPPRNRCPEIESLSCIGSARVAAGATVKFALAAADPESDPLQVRWELIRDEEQYGTGGDAEAASASVSDAIVRSDRRSAEVRLPADGGLYRVAVTVRDDHDGAAIANYPLRVNGPVRVAKGKQVALPLVVYREDGEPATFVPAGWMGDTGSIQLDPAHTGQPHDGVTCLRCSFQGKTGWGGVAWQSPAQDWGDRAGGFDLTGASRLVFFARGEQGGEDVSFAFGLIGRDKRFFDTAKRSLDHVRLTREWQRFEIPVGELLSGEDLTRIKTGFAWTLASPGRPVVFYLDDIHWE